MKKRNSMPTPPLKFKQVLLAKRQQHQQDLKEQAECWQESLDIVTESVRKNSWRRTRLLKNSQSTCKRPRRSWNNMKDGVSRVNSRKLFAESNALFSSFSKEDESEAQSQQPLLPQAPLTPAVCHGSSLTPSIYLPQRYLFNGPLPPILGDWRNTWNKPQLKRRLQELTSNGKLIGMLSSKKPLSKIQRLEESQQASVGGQAPTLPTTQAYPTGHITGLTIGQPSPVLPSSANRGPWAAMRDRFQMMTSLPQAPLLTRASTSVLHLLQFLANMVLLYQP